MTEHRLNLNKLAESMRNGAHSIFSASGSGLWMNCAGGLIPNLLAPDDSGYEAAEGTVAHGVAETWLRDKKRPKHLIGTVERVSKKNEHFDVEITAEMLNYVQEYVDWVSWLPGKHYVETKVFYSDITPIPEQGGTCDFAACVYQRLVIVDFKYGKGHLVEVKNNSQALLYALGFFNEFDWLYDFQEIEIRICQPRKNNLDTWIVTREELLAFAEQAKVRSYLAWSLNAPRTPGEKQCEFCRVKATCAPHMAWQSKITEGFWTDLIEEAVSTEDVDALKERIDSNAAFHLSDPNTLTTEQLAKIYPLRSMFESWWKHVHNELAIRAAEGKEIPGMKMVQSRSKRLIRNEKLALFALEIDYHIKPSELVKEIMSSPAEIERLLRKHGVRPKELGSILDPLVYKPPGKPTLVPLSDRREAIVDFTEVAFSDLTLETENPETED